MLGAVMSSINIIYLVLQPVYIAKQHSEEMAQIGDFQAVSYTGTIVGVVIALSSVGKYLFSDNLATLLDYWTNEMTRNVYSDLITSSLQIIAISFILGPIRKEFKESHICRRAIARMKKCCCKQVDDDDSREEREVYL